jgi:hypothetical protein
MTWRFRHIALWWAVPAFAVAAGLLAFAVVKSPSLTQGASYPSRISVRTDAVVATASPRPKPHHHARKHPHHPPKSKPRPTPTYTYSPPPPSSIPAVTVVTPHRHVIQSTPHHHSDDNNNDGGSDDGGNDDSHDS